MIVSKKIQFNRHLVETYGKVIRRGDADDLVLLGNPNPENSVLVEFNHEGVEFCGMWDLNTCTVIES